LIIILYEKLLLNDPIGKVLNNVRLAKSYLKMIVGT
jgi:hypothetical protein